MTLMKQTCNRLKTLFWVLLVPTVALYLCGDLLHFDMAFMSGADAQVKYVIATFMILLTLSLVPLSLRLFKIQKVHDDLMARRHESLEKWGCLRILLLGGLLLINTFFYYALGFESAYSYLAVVVLLSLPFVYPTMYRCMAETEELKEKSKE